MLLHVPYEMARSLTNFWLVEQDHKLQATLRIGCGFAFAMNQRNDILVDPVSLGRAVDVSAIDWEIHLTSAIT